MSTKEFLMEGAGIALFVHRKVDLSMTPMVLYRFSKKVGR
jgi:hypothetical protein